METNLEYFTTNVATNLEYFTTNVATNLEYFTTNVAVESLTGSFNAGNFLRIYKNNYLRIK